MEGGDDPPPSTSIVQGKLRPIKRCPRNYKKGLSEGSRPPSTAHMGFGWFLEPCQPPPAHRFVPSDWRMRIVRRPGWQVMGPEAEFQAAERELSRGWLWGALECKNEENTPKNRRKEIDRSLPMGNNQWQTNHHRVARCSVLCGALMHSRNENDCDTQISIA